MRLKMGARDERAIRRYSEATAEPVASLVRRATRALVEREGSRLGLTWGLLTQAPETPPAEPQDEPEAGEQEEQADDGRS